MNTQRLLISILILFLSWPTLLLYSLFVITVFNPSVSITYPWDIKFLMLAGILAWSLLFYMSILWIIQARIPKGLPALGIVCGILELIPFRLLIDTVILLACPLFILAIYLCYCSWSVETIE